MRSADARCDIYSLGCVLHQLLTGEAPYPESTVPSKLLAHRIKPIPSLCQRRKDIPQQLEEVFCRMVSKKANDRFASMSDVYRALASCHAPGAAAELASLAKSLSANSMSDGVNVADLLDDAALLQPVAREFELSPVDTHLVRTSATVRPAAKESRKHLGMIAFVQRNARIWAATVVGMSMIILGAIGVRSFLDQESVPRPKPLDQELGQRPNPAPPELITSRPVAVVQAPSLQPVMIDQSPPTLRPMPAVQAASAEQTIAPAVVEPPMLKPVSSSQPPVVAPSPLTPTSVPTASADWLEFLPMIDLERDPPRRGNWAAPA